mmetsp:Transcript_12124/g.28009  ORF Transcript_12124/g.28009 Transcript_12124/m.28009 type:complete len:271 (-) Transcript_12124:26-838(-)
MACLSARPVPRSLWATCSSSTTPLALSRATRAVCPAATTRTCCSTLTRSNPSQWTLSISSSGSGSKSTTTPSRRTKTSSVCTSRLKRMLASMTLSSALKERLPRIVSRRSLPTGRFKTWSSPVTSACRPTAPVTLSAPLASTSSMLEDTATHPAASLWSCTMPTQASSCAARNQCSAMAPRFTMRKATLLFRPASGDQRRKGWRNPPSYRGTLTSRRSSSTTTRTRTTARWRPGRCAAWWSKQALPLGDNVQYRWTITFWCCHPEAGKGK